MKTTVFLACHGGGGVKRLVVAACHGGAGERAAVSGRHGRVRAKRQSFGRATAVAGQNEKAVRVATAVAG